MSIIVALFTIVTVAIVIYYTKLLRIKHLLLIESALLMIDLGIGVILYLNEKNSLLVSESNIRNQLIDSCIRGIDSGKDEDDTIFELQSAFFDFGRENIERKQHRAIQVDLYDHKVNKQSFLGQGDLLIVLKQVDNQTSYDFYHLLDYFSEEQLEKCYEMCQSYAGSALVHDVYANYNERGELDIVQVNLYEIDDSGQEQQFILGSSTDESFSLHYLFDYEHQFELNSNQVFFFKMNHSTKHALEGIERASQEIDRYYITPMKDSHYEYFGTYDHELGSYCIKSCGQKTLILSIYSDIYSMILENKTFMDDIYLMVANTHFIVYMGYCFYLFYLYKKVALEQSKDELINAIAHEMKTPTSVILNGVEMLRENIQPDKRDYYLDITYRQSLHLNQLLMDMLSYARVNASYKLNKTNINLYDMIEELLEQYLPYTKEVIVEVNKDTFIYADEKLIRVVLDNFINNAFEYSTGLIKIKYRNRTLEVSNTGQNISEEAKKHLWEPLHTSKSKGNYKHSGIGLAISANILKKHHYRYGMKQTEGYITFYFITK